LLRANYGKEEVDYDVLKTIIANMLYEELAEWNEFGDSVAWYHARLAKAYECYDEVVDQFDYKYSYAGPRYYRISDVWIRASWGYCNKSRHGYDVGIQKCATYSYESPEQI